MKESEKKQNENLDKEKQKKERKKQEKFFENVIKPTINSWEPKDEKTVKLSKNDFDRKTTKNKQIEIKYEFEEKFLSETAIDNAVLSYLNRNELESNLVEELELGRNDVAILLFGTKGDISNFTKRYKIRKGCYNCNCKYSWTLSYHHRNKKEKIDDLPKVLCAKGPLIYKLRELKKCIILCKRCHSSLHYCFNKLRKIYSISLIDIMLNLSHYEELVFKMLTNEINLTKKQMKNIFNKANKYLRIKMLDLTIDDTTIDWSN